MEIPHPKKSHGLDGAFAGTAGHLPRGPDSALFRALERHEMAEVLLRHRAPLHSAAEMLCERLYGITRSGMDPSALDIWARDPGGMLLDWESLRDRSRRNPFVGNAYRLCAFLGRVEFYRRDPRARGLRRTDEMRRLDAALANIGNVLADTRLNRHPDREGWRDLLIPREDQASIADFMLEQTGAPLDPDRFSDIHRLDPEGLGEARGIVLAARYFDDIAATRDFRVPRTRLLVVLLIDLIELLSPGRVDRLSAETALRWLGRLDRDAGGPDWKSGLPGIDAVRGRLEELARPGDLPATPGRRSWRRLPDFLAP